MQTIPHDKERAKLMVFFKNAVNNNKRWFETFQECRKDKTAFMHEGETTYRCNRQQGKKACMLSKCPKIKAAEEEATKNESR